VIVENAFKTGYEAGDFFRGLLSNPYDRGTEAWHDWRLGWLASFDERRSRLIRDRALGASYDPS
jgi:hypothetical protein